MAWLTLAELEANKGYDCHLVTVPRTGTFFTRDLLDQMGAVYDDQHVQYYDAEVDEYWRDWPKRRWHTVCTLRDPMRAHSSAIVHGATDTSFGKRAWAVEAWKILASWMDAPNVLFFSVDGPVAGRDQELQALGDFLKLPAPTSSWDPIDDNPVGGDPNVLRLLNEGYISGGTIHPDLMGAFQALQNLPDVSALYAAHGYNLRWMS